MSKVVSLSKDTLEVLKVAAAVNNALAFKAGSEIKTMSISGVVVMEATIAEAFPVDFNIYEMNKFLSVLSLPNFKDAQLVFEDDEKYVRIKAGNASTKYYFSAAEFVQHPGRQIVLPEVHMEVEIKQDMLENFSKACSALGHKVIKFVVQDKIAYLIGTTPEIDTSNDYVVELGEVDFEDFSANIKLDNINQKLVPGDYKVQLFKSAERGGISRFEHLSRKIIAFIGIEREQA